MTRSSTTAFFKLKLFRSLIVLLMMCAVSCSSQKESTFFLVQNKKSKVVIVKPDTPTQLQIDAIENFLKTVELATGARIPVVTISESKKIDKGKVKIIVGPSSLTQELGYSQNAIEEEEFFIKAKKNRVIILAEDLIPAVKPGNIWSDHASEKSRVTQWAFGYLLDEYLGVKWLWPGDLGTYIPEQSDFKIPEFEIKKKQPLVRRTFNPVETNKDNLDWLAYHQFSGQRKLYHFQHSFRKSADNGDWWGEFNETRPELLAKNPEGSVELYRGRDKFYKLCISNPEVAEEIIKRWQSAGSPDFWDITPNDGNGFCTCDRCMALDEKYGGKKFTKEQVWDKKDNISLTGRYAWFWNTVVTQMRQFNQNAKVGVFLYSAYRDAPKLVKLEPGIVGEMVHSMDFTSWKEWIEAGISEIGLRPNWLYMGASAPHLPLTKVGSYVEQAREHNMALIDMDCFHEYWATQGPYYYLLGRLVSRPDLNSTLIIAEYTSAFEEAAPQIKQYLEYWEEFHEKVGYNIPAGGSIWPVENGLYEQMSLKHFGERMHPLKGHWKTLPFIYTDDVLSEAYSILQDAKQNAKRDITKKRVDFLMDGLVMLEKNIAYMKAYNDDVEQDKTEALKALNQFQEDMLKKHGYWNSKDVFFMKYWGIIGKEMDTEGM